MNIINIKILFIFLIESIFENLPISSTFYIILISNLINIDYNYVKDILNLINFSIFLSIYLKFKEKLNFILFLKLLITLLPILIFNIYIYKYLKFIINNLIYLLIIFIIFSIIIIFNKLIINNIYSYNNNIKNEISIKDSLLIGIFTCLSFIPGVSRLGSTILGGLLCLVNYNIIIDYSYMLNIIIKLLILLKTIYEYLIINDYNINFNIKSIIYNKYILFIIISNILSFIVSKITINYFYNYLKESKENFINFGYYRILLVTIIFIIYYIINNNNNYYNSINRFYFF